MKRFVDWLTGRTSVRNRDENTGSSARFSRPCGAVVPIRAATGLPSPNSRAAERVRSFLVLHFRGAIGDIADSQGREPSRFYREHEGANALSWDWVDRAGAQLPLAERLALGRFLMDRWGLRCEVGNVDIPGLEEKEEP